MKRSQSAALFAAVSIALVHVPAGAQTPAAPGPIQRSGQVIFWAHYMPQVPLSAMHNGTDVMPMVTQDGDEVEQGVRTIEAALDSGINGFQMLCGTPDSFFESARRVREQTGRIMYIAPEWCDQKGDAIENANEMAAYALKHDADPCVAKVDGAQIHFFYGDVNWAKGDGLARAREVFKQRGVRILLVPTIYCLDRFVLDRPDLVRYQPWPAFEPPKPGDAGDWLAKCPWDGATGFGTPWRADVAGAMTEKLRTRDANFTFLPDVWPSYDCSNRDLYAIHCRIQGLTALRDGLRIWTRLGYKQMSLVTWNDMNETTLMPSSRDYYGSADMIRYAHSLAETGQSPFDAPKFVVAYQPETMIGDQAAFQCDILPEHNTVSSDYVVTFRLEDQAGQTVATLASRATTTDERDDPFIEVRFDPQSLAGKTETLDPYVSVRQYDHALGEMRVLYDNVRLAPIRLRYNQLRFQRPMIFALDRVAADPSVDLSVKTSDAHTASVTATVAGHVPLKRLVLADGQVALGSFREDDTRKGVPAGQTRQFVRIGLDRPCRCRLRVEGGTIEERYTPYWTMSQCRSVGPVAEMEYDAKQNWGAPWNVFRITGRQDARFTLTTDVKGTPQSVTVGFGELEAGAIRKFVRIGSNETLVTFMLVAGTTEANLDYPLPADGGAYVRSIPVNASDERVRTLHAYAITADGKIAFSRPAQLLTDPSASAGKTVSVRSISSGGVSDDFVDDHAEESRCPYTQADIRTVSLAVRDIPSYCLSLDEGAGIALNDAGVGHQFGQAWLQVLPPGKGHGHYHAEAPDVLPADVPYEWIDKGWRGSAVKLHATGAILVRSTSWPCGAVTVSARLHVAGAASPTGESTFSIGPFTARFGGGKVAVSQRFTSLKASGPANLPPGWNHVAFVYDLTNLKVYVGGQLVATSPSGTPVIQRTHWAPEIRILSADGTPPVLDGGIDQIEVIGCAVDAAGVKRLADTGKWE